MGCGQPTTVPAVSVISACPSRRLHDGRNRSRKTVPMLALLGSRRPCRLDTADVCSLRGYLSGPLSSAHPIVMLRRQTPLRCSQLWPMAWPTGHSRDACASDDSGEQFGWSVQS